MLFLFSIDWVCELDRSESEQVKQGPVGTNGFRERSFSWALVRKALGSLPINIVGELKALAIVLSRSRSYGGLTF
jgi:hypothetical protein